MKGKTALVTGGAQGIGRGVAERFVMAGAAVLLVDVEGEPLRRTAEELTAAGGRCEAIEADVESSEERDYLLAFLSNIRRGYSGRQNDPNKPRLEAR